MLNVQNASMPPYPAPVLILSVLGTQAVAVLIVGFGILVAPLPWAYVAVVWAYCIAWMFIEDWAKLAVRKHLKHAPLGVPILQRHRSAPV